MGFTVDRDAVDSPTGLETTTWAIGDGKAK
jgi:hypothetical protein